MKILYNLVCKELKNTEIKAIKKFAEKLKEKGNMSEYKDTFHCVYIYHIDDLVKEMEEKLNVKS